MKTMSFACVTFALVIVACVLLHACFCMGDNLHTCCCMRNNCMHDNLHVCCCIRDNLHTINVLFPLSPQLPLTQIIW